MMKKILITRRKKHLGQAHIGLAGLAFVIMLALAIGIAGCKNERAKLQTEMWLIDPADSTLYRVINKPDGSQVEQFYSIPQNPKLMKRFGCYIDTDRKAAAEYVEQHCN